MNSISFKFESQLTAFLITVFYCGLALGQEFREPNVETAKTKQESARQFQGKLRAPSTQGFGPQTTKEGLGLIPVRPRKGNLGDGNMLQLRPDYSGARSSDQERIIDQIRSDTFDAESPAVVLQQGPQTIRQRYENGKDQLVRQVIQDKDGNFYNHGPWRLYNRNGELVASGQFVDGAMDGTWERWHAKNAEGIFQTKPFTDFEGPFVSSATFKNGDLNGVWVISDRGRRKIVEVPYQDGRRHGTATWWYANAERMRVVNFKDGELDGPMLEWNDKNELVRNDEFIRGQKVIRTTTMYRPKQRSSETYFLDAELSLEGRDSWWDAQPAEFVQSGSRIQHGPAFAWYPNGQRKMVGQYRNDLRIGAFTWWHANGQKALAGKYQNGKKVGNWAWWHENGMKSIEGEYEDNEPVGEWTWWDLDGRITQQDDFGQGGDSTGILVTPENDGMKVEDDNPFESEKSSPPETGIDELENIRPIESFDPPLNEGDLDSSSTDGDQQT